MMLCNTTASKSSGSRGTAERLPVLLHFDVNKTVIQSDSIQMKSCEEGVREGISELYWGVVKKKEEENKIVKWEWTMSKPSCAPPDDSGKLINYAQYCKLAVKDKKEMKLALKSWNLVEGEPVRAEMEKLLHLTMKRMQLPPEVRNSKDLEAIGLKGPVYCMFPTLFHMVAHLQQTKRVFALLFRSFGADHEKIQMEWNAFCELRHPIFSRLIQDIGPMDGTVPNVPDRRIHGLHTLYRDAIGTLLILDVFTNGPEKDTWDSWAKKNSKTDTREGRVYISQVLKAKTVEGVPSIQKWMKQHLLSGGTAAIKDDWAWWQFNNEMAHAGKLLPMIPNAQQLFFDDNIGHSDARIVDCRDVNGSTMPFSKTNNKICVKVNPVEALLDDEYFLRKFHTSLGDLFDTGKSLIRLQKQLLDVEEERTILQKQMSSMNQQLQLLADENKRMKMQRRFKVRDESELQSILAKEVDLSLFDQNGSRSLSDLLAELEQHYCWLEQTESGKIVRVLDMLFLKIYFKDLILIETHEQDASGRVQGRNYLPGVVVSLKDTQQAAIQRWFASGLGVDLRGYLEAESVPTLVPDAPAQVTGASHAYPITCVVQNSQASFIIPEMVELTNKEAIKKIGLPEGKHFTTSERDIHGSTITRYWRWDKRAAWEAGVSQGGVGAGSGPNIDVTDECEKLFKGHKRGDIYKRLLLEMFDIFRAQILCGGFSGSIVIRVQPYEADGRMGEACIVKLDMAEAIREEFTNSENVFKALPDRAARILGDAVYAKNNEGEEFGAMRLELAGACWNNPELAQGGSNLLSTFKDLLLYESENTIISGVANADEVRPFGNVNSVLAETFGPGGVVPSLRNGGQGLRRAIGQPLVWGFYSLKGKEGKFNPYTAKKGEYHAVEGMKKMYRQHFGGDMPPLKELVQGKIKPQLESLAKICKEDLCPLIGLAHGDLNAANIMIDALDAVWLIDFATSVDLPLFTDMCKFEMACLFEYSTIPLTPRMFLDLAGKEESQWDSMHVGDWLKVDEKTAFQLLHKFLELPEARLNEITESELQVMFAEIVNKSGKKPDKKREIMRCLRARFSVDEANTTTAMSYCKEVTHAVLAGVDIKDSLDMKAVPAPEGRGSRGAASLRFFMDTCVSVRRFMLQDISALLREQGKDEGGVKICDVLALQLWLPFLRESFRIVGYRDIPPQFKTWVIYHCSVVAKNVQSIIEILAGNVNKLHALPLFIEAKAKLFERRPNQQSTVRSDTVFKSDAKDFAVDSFLLYCKSARYACFSPNEASAAFVRRLHAACPVVSKTAGFYAPIWEVRHTNGPLNVTYRNSESEGQPNDAWTLCYKDNYVNGVGLEKHPRRIPLGWMVKNNVVLFSRLLNISSHLMRRKMKRQGEERENEVAVANEGAFSLQAWTSSGSSKDQTRAVNVPLPVISNPKEFFKLFMSLEIEAVDNQGVSKAQGKLGLQLGSPAICYPVGSDINIDLAHEGASQSPVVTVLKVDQNGTYTVCNAATLSTESEAVFEPEPYNHTFNSLARYQVGDRILFRPDAGYEDELWMEGLVAEVASQDNRGMYKIEVKGEDEAIDVVRRHLNYMTSGRLAASLTASLYEEEVQRIKNFFRARYSFIIDSLSGQRISIKETAPPTLRIIRDQVWGESSIRESSLTAVSSMSKTLTGRKRIASGLPVDSIGDDGDKVEQSPWNRILGNLECLEKCTPPCNAYAYLVLGSPGSGKTCLVYRVINEILDRHQTLVPLLLPISDLVKRSSVTNIEDVDVSDWFDKYLRITFGEDSHRYNMIVQALKMRRVVLLFEGLEDGGAQNLLVESCITRFVMDRHMCLITSRPLLGGQSTLEYIREHIVAVKMQHLSDEHKRLVAQRRLGLSGIEFYDRLFAKLREGSADDPSVDTTVEDMEESDVFGNPMMLSMLLCYIQTTQLKALESSKARDDADKRAGEAPADEGEFGGATLTAVYRVAMEVMLARVQSKSQADRHNKDEKIEQCKQILNKMAKHMHLNRRQEICVSEVDQLLPQELMPMWKSLLAAVEAGHAMFLRVTKDSGTTELRFLVKGFQSYFCAMASAQDNGAQLPSLLDLFTEPGWSQMLEMLAEARPNTYVQVVETRLKEFKAFNGDDFLHIAARAGHRPIFQVIQRLSEENKKGINARSNDLRTPLHEAAERGNMRICNLLLDAAANPHAEDAYGRLPIHAAMQKGFFPTAKMLLERVNQDAKATLSKRQSMSSKGESKAQKLAQDVLSGMSELDFLEAIDNLFVELRYFPEDEKTQDRKRTQGALLAVFWITANHYDLFVRAQGPDERLTEQSWAKLQDWTANSVQLTRSTETMGAMLVLAAILNLGKIKPLRKVFVPEIDEPTQALYSILSQHPILVPSFYKLQPHLRHIILSSLKADFNFGQFLQAENLPASLLVVKQILGDEGGGARNSRVNILGFFLFRIFAAMCALPAKGAHHNQGSSFMTEKQYRTFRCGLDALQTLDVKECDQVYDSFLAERARTQGLRFVPGSNSVTAMEDRAMVRLACLARAFDQDEGRKISDAFAALTPQERSELIDFVNADGINKKGFLLYFGPDLLFNARKNPAIGLKQGIRMILNVYKKAAVQYEENSEKVVVIILDELGKRAEVCHDAESFMFTKFEIKRAAGNKGGGQGTVSISPWQLVTDTEKLNTWASEASSLIDSFGTAAVREPQYIKRVKALYPELAFMTSPTNGYASLLNETICGLLVIYWLSMGHADAFTRGQDQDKKLTEQSWNALLSLCEDALSDPMIVNAVMSVLSIRLLDRMPKFSKQLAPDAQTRTEVLEHIFDTCPSVLPSYQRLPQPYRDLARACLTRDLWFGQFLRAEVVAANLHRVKELLTTRPAEKDVRVGRRTGVMPSAFEYAKAYRLCLVCELAACKGNKSLEGSLFLNEENFHLFVDALEVFMLLADKSEQEVYSMFLQKCAKRMGLEYNKASPKSIALVRLACLCQGCKDPENVSIAFEALAADEQNELAKHLCSDGIKEQGFVLSECQAFMRRASENDQVGLAPAVRILLVLYRAAIREFGQGKQMVVNIKLDQLVGFTKEFQGSVSFQELSFELVRKGHSEAEVLPKSWIPVRNPVVLETLNKVALSLSKSIIAHTISEKQFRAILGRTYPELGYFGEKNKEKYGQTFGALLSIFWLINNQYEAFVRNQADDDVLTRQSWAWLQDWLKSSVCLLDEAQLDAALTSLAIHALAKIPEFREELAPNFDKNRHEAALAHILAETPEVVPSYLRQSARYQQLIKDSLSTDFRFDQFLAAENLPANLVDLKEKLKDHGDKGVAFFCFRIFVQMCGKLGSKSLQGSTYMTESQFQRFRPGLQALLQLQSLEPGQAYNTFLLSQGSKGLSRFAAPEHHALARLLCLSAAFDLQDGDAVCQAFEDLTPRGRRGLTRWLTADGIKTRPGYVLSDFSDLLKYSQQNKAVGLSAALRLLVRIQEECEVTGSWLSSEQVKVYVHLAEVAAWANDAGPNPEMFEHCRLVIEQEDWRDTRNFYVGVVRPDMPSSPSGGEYGNDRRRRFCDRCKRCMKCMFFLLITIFMLASAAAAALIVLHPNEVLPMLNSYLAPEQLSKQLWLAVSSGIFVITLMFFLCCICCRSSSRSTRDERYVPLVCESEQRFSGELEPFLCHCGNSSNGMEPLAPAPDNGSFV